MKLRNPLSKKSKGKFRPKGFFTGKKLLVFIVAFGAIGGFLVFRSFASVPQLKGNDGDFVALNPARMLDTTVAENKTHTLQVTGKNGVPASNVSAVVVNLTAAGPTKAGYLTAYPSGISLPGTSSINFAAGQTVANQIIVKVGTGGKINIFNRYGSTRIVVDVAGYISAEKGATGGRYTAVNPARILDVTVAENKAHSLQVTGRAGVPAGVSAVAINLTAAGPTKAGHMTVYPSGTSLPGTSSINFAAGQTVANQVIARVGSDGKVNIHNRFGNTRTIVDVVGYYQTNTSALAASQAGRTVTINPRRILDTTVAENKTHSLDAANFITSTKNIRAVIVNLTAAGPTKAGHMTVYPSGTSLPGTSSINFAAGQTVANQVIARVGSDGKVNIHNRFGNTRVIVDLVGYVIDFESQQINKSFYFSGTPSQAVSKMERDVIFDSISKSQQTGVWMGYAPSSPVKLYGNTSLGSAGFEMDITAGSVKTSCYTAVIKCNRLASGTNKNSGDRTHIEIPYKFSTGKYKIIHQVLNNSSGYSGKWVRHSIVNPAGTTTHLYIEYFGTDLQAGFNNEPTVVTNKYSCTDKTKTVIRVGNWLFDGKPVTLDTKNVVMLHDARGTCPAGYSKIEFTKGSSSQAGLFKFTTGN